MSLVFCTLAGVVLPFGAGILLERRKPLLSLIAINAGLFFAIAAIGNANSVA